MQACRGWIVRSAAGRDKGTLLCVLGQEGEYLLVAGTMPDGGIVTSCYRQIDGLYLTVELRAGAQTAESAQALLTGTFLPNLQVTRNATED